MAAARVQGIGAWANATSVTATWGASTTAGNLVVISLYFGNATPNPTVTDAAGNTYVATTSSPLTNGAFRLWQFYGLQSSGATTFTVAASGSVIIITAADEFSGNAASSPFDKDSAGNGTGTASAVTSFTPTANGEIILATCLHLTPGAATAGTSYTLGALDPLGPYVHDEYRLSSSGAETAPITVPSGAWFEIAGAYKLASGATPSRSEGAFRGVHRGVVKAA